MLIGVRTESVVFCVLGHFICPLTALGVYQTSADLWGHDGYMPGLCSEAFFVGTANCNLVLLWTFTYPPDRSCT